MLTDVNFTPFLLTACQPSQLATKDCERSGKLAKKPEQELSVRKWERQLKAERNTINQTRQNEVLALYLVGDACTEMVSTGLTLQSGKKRGGWS